MDRRQLPLLKWMFFVILESPTLFLPVAREPKLDQVHSALREVAFNFGNLLHEFDVRVRRTESHHMFHSIPACGKDGRGPCHQWLSSLSVVPQNAGHRSSRLPTMWRCLRANPSSLGVTDGKNRLSGKRTRYSLRRSRHVRLYPPPRRISEPANRIWNLYILLVEHVIRPVFRSMLSGISSRFTLATAR